MNQQKHDENKDKDTKRHHEFDGIQEYDNDMPKWWVNLFAITIIFGISYFAWYHLPFFPSQSLLDEYNVAFKAAAAETNLRRAKSEAEGFNYTAAREDHAILAHGKETFVTTCAPCHAADGGGGVGPNLTDSFWIHGGKPANIEATITTGSVEKGMPAWGPILGTEKIREVVTFVLTLKGTKPANPKAPQGAEE